MTSTRRAGGRIAHRASAVSVKPMLAGVLALSFACAASAGFIDNRPPPAAPAAVAGAGAVTSPVTGGAASSGTTAVAAAAPTATAPPAISYRVTREDKTIREALVRWSHSVSWTFDPEHWTVNFDLPILSSADLGTDYKQAVRNLLASTDLTNLPLQPCFYSNNVLRVVPKAELCDKTAN